MALFWGTSVVARMLLLVASMMRLQKSSYPLLVLFVASCVGVSFVPKEQAAREMNCPAEQVRVQSDGSAVGCGKVLHYPVCRGDDPGCKFTPTDGVMSSSGMPR